MGGWRRLEEARDHFGQLEGIVRPPDEGQVGRQGIVAVKNGAWNMPTTRAWLLTRSVPRPRPRATRRRRCAARGSASWPAASEPDMPSVRGCIRESGPGWLTTRSLSPVTTSVGHLSSSRRRATLKLPSAPSCAESPAGVRCVVANRSLNCDEDRRHPRHPRSVRASAPVRRGAGRRRVRASPPAE